MKKGIKYTVLCLVMACTACSKDTNDKLDGKWQLQEVSVDNITEKVDTVYYNFLTSIFMYQIYNRQTERYSVCYGYNVLSENKQLLLDLTIDENSSFLSFTDWESSERAFTIEKLTGSRLILTGDGKRYTFRKF